MDGTVPPRRRYYGIAEVADALGLNRQLVTVWRRRRSWGMPEPDDELASGPLWRGATIEPWIEATRVRLAVPAGAAPLGPEAARRWGRRLFRLLALLLEDEPRPALVARALHELDQAAAAVAAAAPSAERDAVLATAATLRTAAGASDPTAGTGGPGAGTGGPGAGAADPGAGAGGASGPGVGSDAGSGPEREGDPGTGLDGSGGAGAAPGAGVGAGRAAGVGVAPDRERVLAAGLTGIEAAVRALSATGTIGT